MESIAERGPFAGWAADAIGDHRFTLIDVGCSGGIDTTWRIFGERLTAVGFDPNLEEVKRLKANEASHNVWYEAGFVGLQPGDPILERRAGRGFWDRNPWNRLAVARTVEIISKEIKAASNEEKTKLNIWQETELATTPTVDLPSFIEEHEVLRSIDFIKIDIDGGDFDVLQSLAADLKRRQVLGLCLEVNFFGSDHETEHTFHNTDRFMRAQGFDLFGLTTRTYSASALPQRYLLSVPAQNEGGRPFQGDALYLRDLCSPESGADAAAYGNSKLIKLAALFSLGGLPDHAAEVLLTFRSRLDGHLDIDRGLDLLAAETVLGREQGWNYAQIKSAFEMNDPKYYDAQQPTVPKEFEIAGSADRELSDALCELTEIKNSRRYRFVNKLGDTFNRVRGWLKI